MSETAITAEIVSLAAVREAKTKQRITPRNFSQKQVDAPVDGVVDGKLTGDDAQVDGHQQQVDGVVDGKLTAPELAANRLQSKPMIDWLKGQYDPETAATVLTGSILLAKHIHPGEQASTIDIINATVTDGISYRMLTDKCKPFLIHAGIWLKISGKEYRWVNWKKPPSPANGVQMEAEDVQIAADASANDQQPACKRNPIDRLRQWQRNRYLEAARADVWKQVKEDGTVIAIPKPGQGAMTEKQKELHRKAAWADHEGKLKLKIEQGANKELMQTIQREELAAIQQEKAILNQARILAAAKRGQRTVLWERTKPLAYLAVIAIIGAALYNGKPASQLPTIQQANTVPPVQGTYP